MECVAGDCGYTIVFIGGRSARHSTQAQRARSLLPYALKPEKKKKTAAKAKYNLNAVSSLCSSRVDGKTVNKAYIKDMWLEENPNARRLAFYSKSPKKNKNASMHGFAIYEVAEKTRSGLLEYSLHLICVEKGTDKAKSDTRIGIFKYMMSDILTDLQNKAALTGATEARLKIMAIESAYDVWWQVGFRPVANSVRVTRSSTRPLLTDEGEFPDDGKPMYLWVLDDRAPQEDRSDWKIATKPSDSWINSHELYRNPEKRPSSPGSFYSFALNHRAENEFPNYSYSANYDIDLRMTPKEIREFAVMEDDIEYVIL